MEFDPNKTQLFEQKASGATEPLVLADFEDIDQAREFVNWCLSGTYTDEGAERWWDRPRTKLEGQCPNQAWNEQPEKVIGLAGWLVNRNLEAQ